MSGSFDLYVYLQKWKYKSNNKITAWISCDGKNIAVISWMSQKGKQLFYVGNKQDYLLNGVNLATAVAKEEEKTVSEDENQGDGYGVEVLVGDKDVAYIDDELQ